MTKEQEQLHRQAHDVYEANPHIFEDEEDAYKALGGYDDPKGTSLKSTRNR